MKGSRCAWIGLLLCVLEGCHSTTPTPPTSPLPTPPPTPKEDSSEDASVQVVAAVIVGFLFIVGMLLYCWYSKNARRRKAKAAPQRDIGDEIAKAPILRTPEPSPQPRQHPLHPRVHVFQLNDRVLTSDGKRGTVTLLSPDNTYTVELDSGSMVLDSYPEDYLTAAPPLYQVGDRVLHDGERATVESVDGATYGIVTDNGNKVASVPEANLARAMKFKVGDIVLCTHPATKQVLVAVVTQADEATGRYVVKFESDGAIFEGIPEDELELAKEEFKEGDVVTAYNPKSGRVETGVVETVDGRNFTYTVRYHSDGLNTVPQHALQLHNGFLVGDRVVETASGRKGTVLGVLPEEGAYIISYDGTPGEGSTTPGVALMKDAVPSSIIITAAPQFNIGDVVASTSARKAGKVTQTDPLTVTWLNGKQQVVRDNEIALYNGFLPGDRVVATYTGTPVHGTVVKIKDKKGYYRVKWDDGRVREVHHSKLGTNMGPKHAVGDIVTAYNPETGTVETAVVTHLNATTQTYTVQYHSSGLVDTVPEHALEAYDGYLIGQRVATNKGNGPSRPGTVVGILDPVKGTYLIRHDDASSGHPKEVSAEWVSPLSPAAELTPSTPLLSSSMTGELEGVSGVLSQYLNPLLQWLSQLRWVEKDTTSEVSAVELAIDFEWTTGKSLGGLLEDRARRIKSLIVKINTACRARKKRRPFPADERKRVKSLIAIGGKAAIGFSRRPIFATRSTHDKLMELKADYKRDRITRLRKTLTASIGMKAMLQKGSINI